MIDKENDKIVGILYIHDIVDFKDTKKSVSKVCSKKIYFVNKNQNLDHVLNVFTKKREKLFIVINKFKEYVGIVTIEDVIEEIIGKEIVDEFDEYEDVRKVAELKAKS